MALGYMYTVKNATQELHSSLPVTSILCDHIPSQGHEYGCKIIIRQPEAKALVCQENKVKTSTDTEEIQAPAYLAVESYWPSKGEGSVNLAYCSTSSRAWLCSSQGCFP